MDDSPENPQALDDLFQSYKRRHTALFNWSIGNWITARSAGLFGADLYHTTAGFLIGWATNMLVLLLPAVIITALTRSWAGAPALEWLVIALLYGSITMVALYLIVRANDDLLALHSSIASAAGLRRLIAWDRRWFSYPVTFSLSLLVVALCILAFQVIQSYTGVSSIHPGTQVIGLMIFYTLGEVAAPLILLVSEIPLLASEDYRLFRFNPVQTVNFQRSLGGYNRIAGVASLYATANIFTVAVLLQGTRMVIPLSLALLALAYSSVALIVVAPRLLISHIVRAAKSQTLAPLQGRLNELWQRLPDIDQDEYRQLRRLQKIHQRLYTAPDNLLNISRVLGTLAAALFLPTLTTIISVLLQNMLGK